ncbi:phenylalanine--tRNA ligase beta subunit-related protein [Rhodoplanes sp. TEM]|uniref:Phenylalanine--tRNA ligase beta subunit-related protein n=1 Tax=Rhodoplanes tepidamans TaxID=200616 RepID=A0ABT5JAN6_RHOTP|nr:MULTISPECIES: phenylalanine--tRNA ligase beta subunit-related protein [Rhodoplanes]MDC7786750.1 phenylalanine--tRNA ligase beta subunit-related protein [Rhodoplanes tepidamans]MDC7983756.1 phenylalanine--tRNA ligase beta subunit-related protein [Rhodoplanes sp. TEM]MDQ0358187.1 DNA/RNA-binding domain of Phe-tRNA-synthetase-like protein [Rhodoplanes tepidamans]
MHITIDPAVRAACPSLALGLVEADVVNATGSAALGAALDACAAAVTRDMVIEDIARLPAVQALRRAYRALGKDPTRYRGSQEALMRRILRGLGLYRINTVVDLMNLVSIESRQSLGVYDRDRIVGDEVLMRVATAGETYKGIGKDLLNLEGLPVYVDAEGPFGSPTSDSERAMVTVETRRILLVVTAFGGTDGLVATLDRTAELLRQHAGAEGIATAVVA